MPELPPIIRDQRKIDQGHLNLLAIFHFIGAGLGLIALLFLFGHYMLMSTVFEHPERWVQPNQPAPPPEFFQMFKWFYLVGGVWFVLSGVLSLISGICIQKRRARLLSLIVAGILCVHMPLGTVLGVFTIIVLIRDSVREAYEANQALQTTPITRSEI